MKPIEKLVYPEGYDCIKEKAFIAIDKDLINKDLSLDEIDTAEKEGRGEWRKVEIPRTEVIDDMLDKIEELRERVNKLSRGHSDTPDSQDKDA